MVAVMVGRMTLEALEVVLDMASYRVMHELQVGGLAFVSDAHEAAPTMMLGGRGTLNDGLWSEDTQIRRTTREGCLAAYSEHE